MLTTPMGFVASAALIASNNVCVLTECPEATVVVNELPITSNPGKRLPQREPASSPRRRR